MYSLLNSNDPGGCTLNLNTALVCLAHWCVCCVGVSSALDLRPVIVRLRVGVSSALVC